MRADRRALAATAGLLAAAAAALGGAAALTWARRPFAVPLRGTVPVAVDGAGVSPSLGPLALLALAAVAAVLATGGWARRVLGAVFLAAAVPPASATVRALAGPDALVPAPARSAPAGAATLVAAGPLAAVLGALLLVAAGVLLAAAGHRMPRLGSRYRTPVAARADPPPDPERRLWESLDAGEDPTADPR